MRHLTAAFALTACGSKTFLSGPDAVSGEASRKIKTLGGAAGVALAGGVAACGANLPQIAAPQLVNNAYATEIVGRPDEIYQRIARHAQRCWFGPFGFYHGQYMMHADVPPPTAGGPVTITVHRRLADEKKPWGPGVLRLELNGQTTTTLAFANIGLDAAGQTQIKAGLTRWANGRDDCGSPPASGDGLQTGATTTRTVRPGPR